MIIGTGTSPFKLKNTFFGSETFCSYDLNGTNGRINYGNILNSTISGTSKIFTISMVVKRDTISQQAIFSKWNGNTNQRGLAIRFSSTDQVQLLLSSNGTSSTDVNSSVAKFTNITDFYFVSIKFDMSAANWSGVKLNINGIDSPWQVTSGAISSTIFNSSANLYLSALTSGAGSIIEHFNGLYNDIALYDKDVSNAELLARYNGGNIKKPTTISNLVWASDFVEDEWDGSNYDVIDNVGALDGATENVLEAEKICVII